MLEEPPCVRASGADLLRAGRGLAHDQRPLEELQRDVLSGRRLRHEIAPPRQEAIDPRDDRVLVPPNLVDVEASAPLVDAFGDERHWRFVVGR